MFQRDPHHGFAFVPTSSSWWKLILLPRPGWRDLAGRFLACPTPSRQRPTSRPGTRADRWSAALIHGRLRWLCRLPQLAWWHATASTGPRFHEDGQTARPGNRKGQDHVPGGGAPPPQTVAVLCAHPKVVAEVLGHANISITLDAYSHAIPAMQESAAATVARLVFGC
jgi:hypothetical protein